LLESKVRVLEYDVTFAQGVADSAEEVENPRLAGWSTRARVLLERGTLRGCIDYGYQPAEPTAPLNRRIAAFDGTTSTQLVFVGRGCKSGRCHPGPWGFIGSSPVLDVQEIMGYTLGLDVFPAFYGHGKGVAHAVREAREMKVVDKPDGILEVHLFEEEIVGEPHKCAILPHPEGGPYQNWRKIVLDLARGGIITAVTEYTCWPNDPTEYTNSALEVQHQEAGDGDWTPQTARRLDGCLSRKTVMKYEYGNVLHDHFDPESHVERFRVEFPPGTPIYDRRGQPSGG